MKILYVHNYYKIPGGEDTVVKAEIKMLERNGNEVILYSRHNNEMDSYGKLKKLMLPFTTIFNPTVYREIKGLIQKEKVDVIHVHNTVNIISFSVFYAAVKSKVPAVMTIHNFRLMCPKATFLRDNKVCEECIKKGPMHAVKYSCYRDSKLQTLGLSLSVCIHRLTGILSKINFICLTDFNREKLLNVKKINPDKVYVKPNFVDSSDNFVKNHEGYFVYAGRLDYTKGVDVLLEAFLLRKEKGEKLIILGTGPEEDRLKRFSEDNNLSNVEFMGFVDNEKARDIISKACALILPTRWYEGFPMSIAEALSYGTPVITTDIGNPAAIVKEGVCGSKFEKDDPKSLSDAITRLYGYENIRESTFKEFSDKYTEKINYEIHMDIYHKIGTDK